MADPYSSVAQAAADVVVESNDDTANFVVQSGLAHTVMGDYPQWPTDVSGEGA
jgi:hypothetical protein